MSDEKRKTTDPTELCTIPMFFRLRQTEREALEQAANGRPLAAVLRDRLGFDPAVPGRRWPEAYKNSSLGSRVQAEHQRT
jgi:hypothetical protein